MPEQSIVEVDPSFDVLEEDQSDEKSASCAVGGFVDSDDGHEPKTLEIHIDGIDTADLTDKELDRLRAHLIDYLAGGLLKPVEGVSFHDA